MATHLVRCNNNKGSGFRRYRIWFLCYQGNRQLLCHHSGYVILSIRGLIIGASYRFFSGKGCHLDRNCAMKLIGKRSWVTVGGPREGVTDRLGRRFFGRLCYPETEGKKWKELISVWRTTNKSDRQPKRREAERQGMLSVKSKSADRSVILPSCLLPQNPTNVWFP